MKTVICGSRDVSVPDMPSRRIHPVEIRWFYDCLVAYHKSYPITEVVSGHARGSDKMGEVWADLMHIPIKKFVPDWDNLGRKRAGFVRNEEMARYADRVIAFWDGHSRGTQHMIDITEKIGKPLTIWRFDYYNHAFDDEGPDVNKA